MAEEQAVPRIAVDDIVESAARGVLRALNARRVGATELVSSGFFVDIIIRAGGIRAALLARAELNPQPLPPQEIEQRQ
jgi:hypothetical protein